MTMMTKKEWGRISNIEMYLFIEKGMKGGISYIAKNIIKQIINRCNHTMRVNQVNTLCI